MTPRHLFLTGASGFVGAAALDHVLTHTDWRITCPVTYRHHGDGTRITDVLDRHPGQRDRVTVIAHDLALPITLPLQQRIGDIDYLWNIASESHVDRSLADPAPFVRNNVELMLNVLDFARQAQPRLMIHMSTDEVFGPAAAGYSHHEWDGIRPSNPYCLAPGTDVVTRMGLVPIEEFDITKHRTLSRDGANSGQPRGLALRTWQFDHAGKMLKIRTREGREEITCTEEHKFFVRVNAHASGGSKMVERRAGDLKVGDRVCIARSLPFPEDAVEPQPEYARLLGYWVADGSYSQARHRYVRLADQSREMIDFYRSQAEVVCGVSAKSSTGAFGTVYKHGTKDCWYLQFASETLRSRVDLTDRMNVIDQALNFGPAALGQFIAGWIDGDGSISRADNELVTSVAITCYDARLRRQLKFMLRRLGVVAVDDQAWNRLTVTDSRSLQALMDHCPSRKWPVSPLFRKPQRKSGRSQTWMWARIEAVDEVAYDGKVYDLEIDKYHNYTASYFLVHNSASKAAQEAIGYSYWRGFGVPLLVTNTMNLIGPAFQNPEKFLPRIARAVLRGEKLTVHAAPDGTSGSRCWLDIRDFAAAWLWLTERFDGDDTVTYYPTMPTELHRFNIVGEEVSNLDLALLMAEAAGTSLNYELVDYHSQRPGHDHRYSLDGSKLAAAGWSGPRPLRDTVADIVAWYRANPQWLEV